MLHTFTAANTVTDVFLASIVPILLFSVFFSFLVLFFGAKPGQPADRTHSPEVVLITGVSVRSRVCGIVTANSWCAVL